MTTEKTGLIEQIRPYLLPSEQHIGSQLHLYSVENLQEVLQNCKNRFDEEHKKIATEAAAIVNDQLAADRQAILDQQEELKLQAILIDLYRTPINGKLLAQTESNKNLLIELINPGEEPSLNLFVQILSDPRFHQNFSWTSAKTLDPNYRKQQDDQQFHLDAAIFLEFCKQHKVSFNEANFGLVREYFGNRPLSAYELQTLFASGRLSLSSATQSELDQWKQQAIEQRNQFLKTADVQTLRKFANQEAEQNRQAVQQQQIAADQQARDARDQHLGYRPLPPEITKKEIKAASKEQLKKWIQAFGNAQLTARLNEN